MSKRTGQRIRESPLLACEEAWAKIFARAKPLGQVRAALDEASGLVLAGAVRAPIAVPPFDNSAMDGFAVRAADIRGASLSTPRRLGSPRSSPRAITGPGRCEPARPLRS